MATVSVPQSLGTSAVRLMKESSKSLRLLKKVDPRERYVLLYPNCDAAYVGMAFKILNSKPAEQVFEQASELIKKDLFSLCLKGPKKELFNSIENRHIATFVTSHATMAKMAAEKPGVVEVSKAAGGFGIGFMNTLVFSGAMSFENALDLVKRQGEAMDRAAKIVPSAKVKVRFLPATSKIRVCQAAMEHCRRLGIPNEIAQCSITKQSHAHVLEISGHEEAIKYLETEGLRLFKFRYISRINSMPHAFHTELMKPAQDFVRTYLEQKMAEDPNYLKDPESCSVHSSIAGRRLRIVKYIKRDLINFPVSPIKSEQLLHCLYARPSNVAQPNTYVLWSKKLMHELSMVNLRAWRYAKLYA